MSDRESSGYSSGEDDSHGARQQVTKKQSSLKFMQENNDESSDDEVNYSDSEDEDDQKHELAKVKKSSKGAFDQDVSSDEEGEDQEDEDDEDKDRQDLAEDDEEDEDEDALIERTANEIKKQLAADDKQLKTVKLKKLTPKQLEKEKKRIARTGVIYLSTIPPYMKPAKLRNILSKFGEVGRIFLKPEDIQVYKRRVKTGGNKKKKFEEGWVEFVNKKDAKLCCATLNGNKLGGKKGNFYYDDVMNLKYLKNFKWSDLTNSLNKEIQIKDAKLQAELQQIHKINKSFIKNVETSKMLNNIKEKKRKRAAANGDDEEAKDNFVEVKRNFQQRSVTTNRSNADSSIKHDGKSDSGSMKKVLNSIF